MNNQRTLNPTSGNVLQFQIIDLQQSIFASTVTSTCSNLSKKNKTMKKTVQITQKKRIPTINSIKYTQTPKILLK